MFRKEPRRGGQAIAQGGTLGTPQESTLALKGRDNYCTLSGLAIPPGRNPGLHPGLLRSAPLALRSAVLFLNIYSWPANLCAALWSLCVSVVKIALSLVPLLSSLNAQPRLLRYEDSRLSMACTYSIIAYGEDEATLRQAVTAAFDEVDRIDRLMSHYKQDSPLSQLNRVAAVQPVKTDAELFAFLQECVRYSRISGGAFDITVGPLLKAWGFFRGEGRLPGEAELAQTRQRIGYRHLRLNVREQTVAFARAGVELDLGGIAKGYAVDRAVALLKARGITRALISAGGSTMYALGSPPGSGAWEVAVQDPMDARKIALTVRLKNQTLSVSGSAEKYFELEGQRYSHIMDPRTGRPVMNVLSVAVITPTGTAGDALDNVFYVAGIARSRPLLHRFPHTEIYFFLPDATAHWKLTHLKN